MALADTFTKATNVAGIAGSLREYLPSEITNGIDSILGANILPYGTRRGISGFRSRLNSLNGVQRPNLFYVTIPNPRTLQGEIGPILLPFLTETAALPGVQLETSSIRRYGYGPTEKKPYGAVFTDMSMNFYGDGSGVVHKFFYKWLNSIVKYDQFPRGKNSPNGARPFEVEYKRQYATDITITTIDEVEKKIIEVKLLDAYPVFMGDVALSWSDTDSIARIPVTFTYFNWKRTDTDLSLDSILGEDLSPIQRILGAGNAIQTLAKIGVPRSISDIQNVVNNSKSLVGNAMSLF